MTTESNTGGSEPATGTVESLAAKYEAMLSGSANSDAEEIEQENAEAEDLYGDDAEAQQAEAEDTTPEDEADEAEATEESEEADDDAEDESPAIDPATYKVTVKVDGKATEVTLAEAVQGYQRNADYTRKSQTLAEDRKAFDAFKAEATREREDYKAVLEVLRQQIEQLQPDEPDWNYLWQNNPVEATRLKHLRDEQVAKLNAIKVEQETIRQKEEQERTGALEAHRRAETAKLFEAHPEWKDKAKRDADVKLVNDWAAEQGFSREDLGNAILNDHRVFVTVKKAAAYDALMAKKPRPQAPSAPVSQAPRPVATQPVTEVTRAKQRLAKTGKTEDLASLYLKQLNAKRR